MNLLRRLWRHVIRPWAWGALALLLLLQVYFGLRIASMNGVDPSSSAFERSEVARLMQSHSPLKWQQRWVGLDQISIHLRRAVVVSEDDLFTQHHGVHWDALEKAWQRNERSVALAQRRGRSAHLVGGSTITQQVAKNLFLWPGRSYIRKGIEAFMAPIAGVVWGKRRTFELYLNVIEWGEGIYGLEAASKYYFQKPASELSVEDAAALASILPNPRKLSPKSLTKAAELRYLRILKEARVVEVPSHSASRASYRWKRR